LFPCCDPQTTGCHGSSAAVVLKKKVNSILFQSFQNSKYLLLGARKRYLPSCSSFDLSTDIRSLQAKERGVASAAASSVMIKFNFARSEFVVLDSDHLKSLAPSPLLLIKYREEILAGAPQRKLSCGLQCPVSSSSHNMRWLYPAARRGRIAPATASRASAAAKRSFVTRNCFSKTRRVYSSSTLTHNGEETEEEEELGKWRWRFA
jgi:hypothetical protein